MQCHVSTNAWVLTFMWRSNPFLKFPNSFEGGRDSDVIEMHTTTIQSGSETTKIKEVVYITTKQLLLLLFCLKHEWDYLLKSKPDVLSMKWNGESGRAIHLPHPRRSQPKISCPSSGNWEPSATGEDWRHTSIAIAERPQVGPRAGVSQVK